MDQTQAVTSRKYQNVVGKQGIFQSFSSLLLVLITVCGFALPSRAVNIINDTWLDGDRTDPAAPVYAENNGIVGSDADLDGNLESVWYTGGSGGIDMNTANTMRLTNGVSGSSSWTTYFTPDATKVNLAIGDVLRVTWTFTPTGVNAGNTSQNFRLALVNSPSAARLAADGAPGNSTYTGYSMFMNMATTLGNSSPFQLREFATGANSALLSASGAWTALTNGVASGATGYASGTSYTYVMELTRTGATTLDIVSTMTGGSLNGSGVATVSFTDTTPSGFVYDTFAIRPSDGATTAATFDTTLFKVEYIAIPEPSTISLVGLGLAAAAMVSKRRRSRR